MMGDIIEELRQKILDLEDEVKRLKTLAVSESSEGTCFYYRDEWLADQPELKRLRAILMRMSEWGKGKSDPELMRDVEE